MMWVAVQRKGRTRHMPNSHGEVVEAHVGLMKRKRFHFTITRFGTFKDKVHLVAKEVKPFKVK